MNKEFRKKIGLQTKQERMQEIDFINDYYERNKDKMSKYCYNIEKTAKEEDNIMSTISLFFCCDGVLAVGDKKPTLIKDGKYVYDKNRGLIPKIFKNDNLMVATTGNNTIGNLYYIEDAISYALKFSNNKDEFVKYFEKQLYLGRDNRMFNIILYDNNYHDLVFFDLIFENQKLTNIRTFKQYVVSGNELYKNFLKEFAQTLKVDETKNGVLYDIKTYDLKDKIKSYLDKITNFFR